MSKITRLSLPMLAALLLFVAGCDTAGEDLVFLQQEFSMTFEFSPSEVGNGVVWTGEPVLTGANVPGFTRDQISTATIEGVVVTRLQPATMNLEAAVPGATLSLASGSGAPTNVVTLTNPTGASMRDQLVFDPSGRPDIGSFLRASALTARLQFPGSAQFPQTSTVRLRVTFELQVGYAG